MKPDSCYFCGWAHRGTDISGGRHGDLCSGFVERPLIPFRPLISLLVRNKLNIVCGILGGIVGAIISILLRSH